MKWRPPQSVLRVVSAIGFQAEHGGPGARSREPNRGRRERRKEFSRLGARKEAVDEPAPPKRNRHFLGV